MLTFEISTQVNRNATVFVMGSFLLVIGLHQHLMSMNQPKDCPSYTPQLTLESLPYDVLLHVIQYLDFFGVQALQRTSKLLRSSATTRLIYRNFALALLRRNRPLPLVGFQRIHELSTDELIRVVAKGMQIERSWLTGTLKPASSLVSPSYYLCDGDKPCSSWYRVISTLEEDVDWISPISSGYILCSTKTGRVMCWDIHDSTYLGDWKPEEQWELWKCKVEFDANRVFFIMAKIIESDELLGTDFIVMRLDFPQRGQDSKPTFSTLSLFTIPGPVMNVFLLDTAQRLSAAFVYIHDTRNIGLYCLLDWNKNEYVFIDTNIRCYFPSNWSCIVHQDIIVIHCEDREGVYQHFYPLDLLKQFVQPSTSSLPKVFDIIPAPRILKRPFLFPSSWDIASSPLSSRRWYPESAHFVRQWWPTLPSVPKLSCTVFLLAEDNRTSRPTRFVLAQHYFDVPISSGIEQRDSDEEDEQAPEQIDDEKPIARMWFVSIPFEPVCDIDEEDEHEIVDGAGAIVVGKCRPLVAIDFGHAAWIEYVEQPDGSKVKQLRFVSFPPVLMDDVGVLKVERGEGGFYGLEAEVEGRVHTLHVPDELDMDSIETINLDQSQGAILLSVRGGKVFILCYD